MTIVQAKDELIPQVRNAEFVLLILRDFEFDSSYSEWQRTEYKDVCVINSDPTLEMLFTLKYGFARDL